MNEEIAAKRKRDKFLGSKDAGTSEGARKAAQTRKQGGGENRLREIVRTNKILAEARKKPDKSSYASIRKSHPEIFAK